MTVPSAVLQSASWPVDAALQEECCAVCFEQALQEGVRQSCGFLSAMVRSAQAAATAANGSLAQHSAASLTRLSLRCLRSECLQLVKRCAKECSTYALTWPCTHACLRYGCTKCARQPLHSTVLGSPTRSMCRCWPGCRFRASEGHCCCARHTRWCMVRVADSSPATREPAAKQAAALWLGRSEAVTVVGLSSCKQRPGDLQPGCAQPQLGWSCQVDRLAASLQPSPPNTLQLAGLEERQRVQEHRDASLTWAPGCEFAGVWQHGMKLRNEQLVCDVRQLCGRTSLAASGRGCTCWVVAGQAPGGKVCCPIGKGSGRPQLQQEELDAVRLAALNFLLNRDASGQ